MLYHKPGEKEIEDVQESKTYWHYLSMFPARAASASRSSLLRFTSQLYTRAVFTSMIRRLLPEELQIFNRIVQTCLRDFQFRF
jgi:uncharacterized BrkB/YihY/UPF0761 family membrane protein